MADFKARLEYLRGELRAERISMGELCELQGLVEHIELGDVELLEAAGVPEHRQMTPERQHAWNRAAAALRELRSLVEDETDVDQDDNDDALGRLSIACDYFDEALSREATTLTLGEPFKRWTVTIPSGAGLDIYVQNTHEADLFILAMMEAALGHLSAWGQDVSEVPLP